MLERIFELNLLSINGVYGFFKARSTDEKVELIDFNSWLDIFFKFNKLLNHYKNFDIVHIHGIWAPIQLFSIILCNFRNTKVVIHPHGMLLEEAISESGYIKFCLKKFALFLLLFNLFLKVVLNFFVSTKFKSN